MTFVTKGGSPVALKKGAQRTGGVGLSLRPVTVAVMIDWYVERCSRESRRGALREIWRSTRVIVAVKDRWHADLRAWRLCA